MHHRIFQPADRRHFALRQDTAGMRFHLRSCLPPPFICFMRKSENFPDPIHAAPPRKYNPTRYIIYEYPKFRNVALSHAVKKLVRLIYAMEKPRRPYNGTESSFHSHKLSQTPQQASALLYPFLTICGFCQSIFSRLTSNSESFKGERPQTVPPGAPLRHIVAGKLNRS